MSMVCAMRRIPVTSGRVVIKQGDKGDLFYVTERGEFDVFVAQPQEGQQSAASRTRPSAGDLIHTYVGDPAEGK